MVENTIKITGVASIPEGLEMGIDIVVAGRMAIVSIEKKDLENGDYEFTHKGRLTHIETVNKLGKTIRGVKKGSKSQVLRNRILERTDEEGYQIIMGKLIDHLDEVLEVIKKY